ncbi:MULTISPECIES: DUF6351 family protein [Variovorax]|jgi:hypothetical protein|uniref:DUF6351 family protein n=1 Tax=Variovorax TaxID=34072 RepID=UPI0008694E52|nr:MULTISPECIES: DUF6351 family protein [Variovorax]MBN8753714.1 hypothetical protein [Variovorax sp.]ODU17272.1 MAG: hypothetical protein ABS94_09635 [Variovorax sp. SCN 67-85]ODV24344.1 MAG: hypothetical protein ABT25_15035 [Variovorax sp. SCN 67-20]OJZ02649.1 MAG: hypothetical protein BGP22_19740 [Variovorax sp. 67-131]UKI10880.1 DUF6351 family protein [Variovorax paradoxus]
MKTCAPAKRRLLWPVAMSLAALLLGSCGGGSGSSAPTWTGFPAAGGGTADPGTSAPPVSVGKIALATLSGRADMVTGGDTLLEVALPEGVAATDVRVTRNGEDVTSAFSARPGGRALRGLVAGLAAGDNTLAAKAGDKASGELVVTNHPITGPVFSGPHLKPFECRTAASGLGAATDADCSAATTFDWFYFTPAGVRKALADPLGPRPGDLATTTTLEGRTVPFIVRVESGTINRSIYRIAVLDDPAEPGRWNPKGWNGRIVLRFGESTAAQYNQGVNTLNDVFKPDSIDVQNIEALRKGYAYVMSTLNINKVNVNDVLAAETAMMLREHIAKRYGLPRWMVGMGGSGGAIQQMLIAQNYPGILDGLMPDSAFPDVFGTALAVSDCRLLDAYFTNPASPGYPFSDAKRKAVEGHLKGTCRTWSIGNGDAVLATSGSISPACGLENAALVYDPLGNPGGARCTVYDINVNSLGRDPATGFARRPLDNVGVAYGLDGLRKGAITAAEFLDLNEKIGGYDRDGNLAAQRTVADTEALQRAYALGRIGSGSGGLATVPLLSLHPYAEPGSDIHTIYNDLKIREQLMQANGRADNQVIWLFPNPQLAALIGKPGQVQPLSVLLRDTLVARLALMTQWLDGMADDPAPPDADKVARHKPADAVDSCWDVNDSTRYKETATFNDAGKCNVLYPKTPPPRMVAGGPLADNVVKCQLKPVRVEDFLPVTFSPAEKSRLDAIFPDGVCDFAKPGVGQAALKGTWLRY